MSAGSRFPRRDLFARASRAFLAARIAVSSGLADTLEAGIASPHGISTYNSANTSANTLVNSKVHLQRYRVQAAVSLFGVPVVWKDGVGAASLLVEEIESGDVTATAIQFVSGSWPERVKGLNRFGMTQEIVREENGAIRESAYLSFMTSSPETNSDQAWRSFADRPRNLMLAVARGAASGSGYKWTLDHRSIPSDATWMDCPALMEKFRADRSRVEKPETDQLPTPDAGERAGAPGTGIRDAKECVYPTFLHSVRQAVLRRSGESCAFIHNAKLFDLHPRFSVADQCIVLTGRVIERGSSSESEFRVWFDAADPAALPSRIEFRPRSFLHLTFRLDPAAGGPSVRRLLIHEEA